MRDAGDEGLVEAQICTGDAGDGAAYRSLWRGQRSAWMEDVEDDEFRERRCRSAPETLEIRRVRLYVEWQRLKQGKWLGE
jgi:hypothetical protein